MKKLFLKTIAIALFLLAMPMAQYGQQVRNHMIELELEKIDNPDMRYCLLSNIANDGHFQYTVDEENNTVLLFSSEGWTDQQFQAYFNESKSQIQAEFEAYSSSDKEVKGMQFTSWKDALPEDLFVLLFRLMLIENPTNRDGNQTCATSDPFCTTDVVTFHVEANPGGSCESGPYYGCLAPYIDRPPFWFHMKIGVAGAFTIRMTNSSNVDIDYCCWGPFTDPITPCPSQLTQSKYIDCGSSGSANEECDIPSTAQVGQYYIMVITKYNQSTATNITFQKKANSGPGETDCGILPPLVSNYGPYCVGQTIQLRGNAQEGATYTWTAPDGWTASGSTVTRPNCTLAMAGTYTCTIHVGSQSNSATTQVEIFANPTANFTASSACLGQPVQFTSSSTTNPSGQTISSYLWNFGDGQTSTQQNPTHQYSTAGNYNVSLTVSCGGSCSDTKQQTVTVYAVPTANFTATTACQGQPTQFTNTSSNSASQPMTYLWDFGDGQTSTETNPSHQYTTVGNHTVTLTASCGGSCSDTRQQTVVTHAVPTANFTATSVCLGEETQFTNSSSNSASQPMTYSWNFGDGQTSTDQNPTHQYTSAGNYNVSLTVSCGGICTDTKQRSVPVYSNPVAYAGENDTVMYGDRATLNGTGGSGNFNYHWEPADKVVNPDAQTTQTVELTQSETFTLTVTHPEGGCLSTAQVSILVRGSHMTATANATPGSICLDGTSQLSANAIGGTENYTYLWSPTTGLSAPNIANPIAHPTETTTYSCIVSDGQSTQNVTTTVTVNYPEYSEETRYICPGETTDFYGMQCSEEGPYEYETETNQGCEKIITLHLHHYPSYDNAHTTTEFICPGEFYPFHGQNFNTTGRHPVNLHTAQGCDSIVWLDLTVYPENPVIIDPRSICTNQTLTWLDGNVYSQDGDVAYYDSTDSHGCLQRYKLELSVGQYQSPPLSYNPNVYECYSQGETPSYHWDIADRWYYANAKDTIIIDGPAGECDYLYTLNLKFHEEFYQEIDTTVCDDFFWGIKQKHYDHTERLEHRPNGGGGVHFNCDSVYIVNLTVNYSSVDNVIEKKACNEFTWNFGDQSYRYTESINDTKTIETTHGCDSTVTLKLTIDYKPVFDYIEGNGWPLGGSEFQYTVENYSINTMGSHTTDWKLFKISNGDTTQFKQWDLIKYGDNNDRCQLYISTYELDTIILRATATSVGAGSEICGEEPHSVDKIIRCTSYGAPEIALPRKVDIFPNPNDGNMTLSFTGMTGEIIVKVIDMQGVLVDQFRFYNGFDDNTHAYNTTRLKPGVYFFAIASKEGILTRRVVIK
ncbi:MAG: PKD domain-containing protein [Bacteroidales bacterium]|nr:PKD domain-containing protein [Bacteroidales bacterium]